MKRNARGGAAAVDAAETRRLREELLSRDMEAQADDMTSTLLNKAQELKLLSMEIGDHIKGDIDLLDEVEDDMSGVGQGMKKTLRALKNVADMAGGNYWCMLATFIVVLFVSLWFILKLT